MKKHALLANVCILILLALFATPPHADLGTGEVFASR